MSGGHNRKFMADPAGYARDKVILLPVHEKKGFWDEITGAGTDERVAGLVYIAAVVPDVQETVQSQLNKYPTEIFSQIEVAGGRVWIKPEGVKYFAGDLSEQEQKLVWATHYPPAADLLEQQKLDEVAWKSKPSWYVLAQKDQTVHPDLQRFLAKRINATTVETDSSHVTMLSQPGVVIEVIRKAAAAIQRVGRLSDISFGKGIPFAKRRLLPVCMTVCDGRFWASCQSLALHQGGGCRGQSGR